jgi:hypothetical protein
MPGEIEPGGHQVLPSPVQGLVALALVNQVVLYKRKEYTITAIKEPALGDFMEKQVLVDANKKRHRYYYLPKMFNH